MSEPVVILGAGPAGCAAAIGLASAGHSPLLLDRQAEPADALCGGFVSWRTAAQLRALGVDLAATGARRVTILRLFSGSAAVALPLPQAGWSVSRRQLDTHLRSAAHAAGARFAQAAIHAILPAPGAGPIRLQGKDSSHEAQTLFLASGKHDLRGHSRPRPAQASALGLRLRLPASSARQRLLAGAIELHLFAGGYAGIALQEDGSANVCLALRKTALSEAGGDPLVLLARLGARHPALAARLGEDWRDLPRQTIGAVPYGWIAQDTIPALYRLGDQAAVIPSLAGEGIGMALASGTMAAGHWLAAGPRGAGGYQRAFARAAQAPVRVARLCRALAEHPAGSRLALHAARLAPALVAQMAKATRIPAPDPGRAARASASLAPDGRPA